MEQDDLDEQGTWDVDDEFAQELEELAAQADAGHTRPLDEAWEEIFGYRPQSRLPIEQSKISR